MTEFPLNIPPRTCRYVGRFAPSPSGHLHFGSMVAALGSYLQAKANGGSWLVRMEDIDPPREMPGAASHILKTLEQHGLYWDGEVMYQSKRAEVYDQVLDWLETNRMTYACRCTRKQINLDSDFPGIYARTCRDRALDKTGCAVRFINNHPVESFDDRLQGPVKAAHAAPFTDDFIVHRKDGLYAYQLAVVVDDLCQGISEVVRGSDLLETTLHQLTLFKAFGYSPPQYLHLPVAVTRPGKKLSKQNHAKSVEVQNSRQTLCEVMKFLAMPVPQALALESVEAILSWGIDNWDIRDLPRCPEISTTCGESDEKVRPGPP